MTERVQRMLKSLKISKYPLCIEYFKLANESLDQTAGEPMLLRRAKLHAHVLDHMPIFIEPEDLLCGSGASKPFGLEMQYEYGVWTKDEVESLKSEIYTISPEDEEELYRLNERFANNALNSNLVDALRLMKGLRVVTLFVKEENAPVIKMHIANGFRFDGLEDMVFTKKGMAEDDERKD